MSIADSQNRPYAETAATAEQLLVLWSRLANSHAMVGGGCSCGVGGVVVALADFEQDIISYLQAEAERNKRSDVLALLEDPAREREPWRISTLLEHFMRTDAASDAQFETGLDTGAAQFVMERLTLTLGSFEKLHAGR